MTASKPIPSPEMFRARRRYGVRLLPPVAALFSLAVLAAALTGDGCMRSRQAQGAASTHPTFMQVAVGGRPAVTADTMKHGREVYEANCVQCHGKEGAGDGYGAPFLVPPPRDFTKASYKFRTTEAGKLPTDEDIFRTISRGSDGTGMPPWSYLLSESDRWALVDYLKTFSPKFAKPYKRVAITVPEEPTGETDLTDGRKLYEKMECAKCHGTEGRGDGPSARTLKDEAGRFINTRDFTNPGTFRTGWSRREIVRTLLTGMNGTPMPNYAGIMKTAEIYDLAGYIQGLAKAGSGNQRRQAAHGMEGLGTPDRTIEVREHAWKYEPAEIHIKRGKVVRINFSTTDNGLGVGHGFAIDGYDQEVFINGAMVGAPQSVTFRINEPGRYKFYCATQCSTEQLHPNMTGLLVVE